MPTTSLFLEGLLSPLFTPTDPHSTCSEPHSCSGSIEEGSREGKREPVLGATQKGPSCLQTYLEAREHAASQYILREKSNGSRETRAQPASHFHRGTLPPSKHRGILFQVVIFLLQDRRESSFWGLCRKGLCAAENIAGRVGSHPSSAAHPQGRARAFPGLCTCCAV